MEERQSRLSNMDWKRFRPYLCVRLIPQNSMFSNFCHLLKNETKDLQKQFYCQDKLSYMLISKKSFLRIIFMFEPEILINLLLGI